MAFRRARTRSNIRDLCFLLRSAALPSVESLLVTGQTPDVCDQQERTPLMFSVMEGDVQRFELLRRFGADINKTDRQLRNCLHLAVISQQKDFLKKLCDIGVDKNAVDSDGCTPLMVALVTEAPDLAQILLEKRCDVNAGEVCISDLSALQLAVMSPTCHRVVKGILEAGADVNKVDSVNRTALLYSVKGEWLNVMETLLKHHADPNKGYPLLAAVDMRYTEGAILLLSYGSDPMLKSGFRGNRRMQLSPFDLIKDIADEGSEHELLLEAMIREDGIATSTDLNNCMFWENDYEVYCLQSLGEMYDNYLVMFKLIAYGMGVTPFVKNCVCWPHPCRQLNTPGEVCHVVRSLPVPTLLPLSVLCRNKVRLCLGKAVSRKAKSLNIPQILKQGLSAKVWDDRGWYTCPPFE